MVNYKNKYVSELIQLLKDTPGRKDKIVILEDAMATNVAFLKAIEYTYNPYNNYYISSVDSIKEVINLKIHKVGYRDISIIWPILDNLNSKGSANNQDKKTLGIELEKLNASEANVIDMILKRSLDCGVSVSSINKARPGTIPEFKVLLCEKMSEKALSNIDYPAYAQVKMDGMRAIVFIEGSKVVLRTRSGKDIETHGKFEKSLGKILGTNSKVAIDGELLVLKKDQLGYENRRTGNGICNKAVRGTITPEDADRLVFVAWDMVSISSFWAGYSTIPYTNRFKTLIKLFDTSDMIRIVEGIQVDNFYQTEQYYHKQIANGQEGIILKNANAEYQAKRTKDCIKMKVENTAELRIKAVIEGTGKYRKKLGSFICESEDGHLECAVGTGFDDEQRDLYFSDNMIGQIVEIKYNEIIANKTDDTIKSLFLPVFIEMRNDKAIANKLEELA